MIIAGLFLQAFLCIFLLINEVVFKKVRNYATTFFLIIYFLIFIIEPLILHVFFGGARSIVRDHYELFKDDVVYYYANAYGLTLMLIFTVMSLTVKEKAYTKAFVHVEDRASGWLWFLCLLMVLGFALFVKSTGSSINELLTGGRFSWFDNDNAWPLGVAISHYLFSLTPVVIYLFCCGNRKIKELPIFLMAMMSVLAYGILSQDRKFVFYIFSAAVALVYVWSGYKIKISLKFVVPALVVFLFLFISQFVRDYFSRYMSGDVSNSRGALDELVEWLGFLLEYGDISYFYRASLEAIQQTVNMDDIIEPLALIRRNLLFFIPTGWTFGLKPEDLSAIFSDMIDGGDNIRRGNMPPGFFGIFVMSFGLVASLPIIGFLPYFLKKLDLYIRNKNGVFKQVLLASYLSLLLLLLRGDDSSAVYFIIFGFIAVKLSILLKQILYFKANTVRV